MTQDADQQDQIEKLLKQQAIDKALLKSIYCTIGDALYEITMLSSGNGIIPNFTINDLRKIFCDLETYMDENK